MLEFTTDIVIDIPVVLKDKISDFFVLTEGTAIKAIGIVRGLDIVRLLLSYPGLRRQVDRAYDPISISRARVRYPFLFLGAEDTNPLLYREF